MRLTAVLVACLAPLCVSFLLLPQKVLALLTLVPLTGVTNFFFAPTFALLQRLVSRETRATAVATLMMLSNLIGMGVGPQSVGILSDYLSPKLGSESLRYAMLVTSLVALWSAYHFWRAAATVARDLADAANEATVAVTRYEGVLPNSDIRAANT